MQLSKKTELWAVIMLVCLFVSILVLLVDFGIKEAILEESGKLRLRIEEWEVRTGGYGKNEKRTSNDTRDNGTIPGDVLVDTTPGVETRHVPKGAEETS